jgi:tetratricopeptide (TPR) repeat protein
MRVFDGRRRITGKGGKGTSLLAARPSAYAWVLLLGLCALAVLAALSVVRPAGPPALLACASVLFLVPGLLLTELTLGPNGPGVAGRFPVAFAFSSGLFALSALPVLVLHGPLAVYLWLCAGIILASLALAAVLAVRRGSGPEGEPAGTAEGDPGPDRRDLLGDLPLWALLAVLGAVLAWFSTLGTPEPNEDAWVYLAQIREFVGAERLGGTQPYFGGERGLTRLDLNGWLVEQAAMARLSGADVLELGLRYLPPVLILASLLAFYSLTRLLFGSNRGALFAACAFAVYMLASLGVSPGSPGWDFVERATEDKFVARFVFLPVALILATLYLRERRRRYLLAFAFLCWGVAAIHPLGVALIGISCAGFGVLACLFALARRDGAPAQEPALRALALGAAALSLAVPAAVYLVLTGTGVPSLLEATNPSQTAYRLYTWERQERLLVLAQGSYVMHPSLLLQPIVLAAYAFGAPFLAWRAWRAGDIGAQLVLGTLLLSPVLLYVPPVTTFLGGFVGPWTIWRLAWPLELAAFLAVGWVLWACVSASGEGLRRLLPRGLGVAAPALLPSVLLVLAVAAVLPLARTGVAAARTEGETPQSHTLCSDPVFGWLAEDLDGPSVVLAPDNESSCIPTYAADANVVSVRGLTILNNQEALDRFADEPLREPRRAREVKDFYEASSVDGPMVETLRRHEVDRILVPVDSPLIAQFDNLPAFRRLDTPGDRYLMYGVDRGRLEAGSIERANGLLNEGKHAEAVEAYAAAPSRGPSDDFLALLGSGQASVAAEDYASAVSYFEAAVDLDPGSTVARGLLAETRSSNGDLQGARRAYEEALERDPRNVELRLDYGLMLLVLDPAAAIEQHREVVRMYPEVPEYRIKLGGALGLLGRPDEADRELARAVELSPLSARTHADLGKVYVTTGRPEEAIEHYERALELDRQNQRYAYELGSALARLSTEDPGDEDLFRRAEEALLRVDDLEPYAWEADNRAAARISLGDLYASRGRTEDARRAYEEAQRLDPESGARQKLEGLGDR